MEIIDDPKHCLDFVREGGWTWFVDLKYPSKSEQSQQSFEIDSVRESFRTWIDWVEQNFAHDTGISFVLAIEPREDGAHLLHVLLRDVPESSREAWREQWRILTGAGAWDRELNDRTDGLFRHFFYKRCKLVEFTGGYESQYLYKKTEEDEFGVCSWS